MVTVLLRIGDLYMATIQVQAVSVLPGEQDCERVPAMQLPTAGRPCRSGDAMSEMRQDLLLRTRRSARGHDVRRVRGIHRGRCVICAKNSSERVPHSFL